MTFNESFAFHPTAITHAQHNYSLWETHVCACVWMGGAVLYGLLHQTHVSAKWGGAWWTAGICLCSVDMPACVFIYPSTYHLPTTLAFTDCLLGYHVTTDFHHLSFYHIICILIIIYLDVIYHQYRYYLCICVSFISILSMSFIYWFSCNLFISSM